MAGNVWYELFDGALKTPANLDVPARAGATPGRPWPPVMLRDFVRSSGSTAADVPPETTIGDIADFLASSTRAVIAVVGHDGYLMGAVVDSDVMALIQRDGVKALDYPVSEALQCARPVCGATDSPYVVASLMQSRNWDRVAVAERGRVVGVVARRDLIDFTAG